MNTLIEHSPQNADIRIGTLVRVDGDPSAYIRQIAPYGFESYALTFWQTLRGVDLRQLGPKVRNVAAESGATITCIAVYGNPLETGELDRETRVALESAIDHARTFGADIVGGFTGRLRGMPIHACIDRFRAVWEPLARRAADHGVRIAFENCGMGGDWQSGDWNIAHNPPAWEMMFEAVPMENLGLEWEPCHQMMSLIDPIPQLREWVSRIFHIHGKDASVHWDVIRKFGIHSVMDDVPAIPGKMPRVPQFAFARTPGFGDCNWTDIITILRKGGYTGSIDVEGWHDPVYKDELEMTGQVHALNYLKQCRGGQYVPNPV